MFRKRDKPTAPRLDKDYSTELFQRVAEMDRDAHISAEYLTRWLFADRLHARNQRLAMSFYDYLGPEHVWKYLHWIEDFNYADWFGDAAVELANASAERDRRALDALEVPVGKLRLEKIARYNAQDYLLQRAYAVPDRMQPRTILDFGAGHGRQANLAFREGQDVTSTMIAIDGIPGSYLTQRAYYSALGLRLADYLDRRAAGQDFDVPTLAQDHDVLHLPTWRFDLVPDASVDLAICVQVLKELPRQLTIHVLEQMERVVKPGGALYIRDHPQNHNPNQMPIEQLLLANGFVLEYAPQVKDRVEIHGLPRIWRRLDTGLLFDPDADV